MTLLLPPSRLQRRRSLLQAQVDFCVCKGIGLRQLDGGGGGKGGGKAAGSGSSSHHVSLTYAGTTIETQVVLYTGRGGGGRGVEDAYDDEDDEDEDEDEEGDDEPLSLPLPDLLPLSLDAGSPSSSSSASLHDAYSTLRWETLHLTPPFAEWEGGREGGRGSKARGLFDLLLAVKGEVMRQHVERVKGFTLEDGVRFEVDMLAGLPGVELLTRTTYAGHEIHVLLPLWPPPSSSSSSPSSCLTSDEDEDEDEDGGEDDHDPIQMSQDQNKTPGGGGGAVTPPSPPSSSSCPPFGRHLQLHLTYTLDPFPVAATSTTTTTTSSNNNNNRTTTTTSKLLLPEPSPSLPSLALPLTRQTLLHHSPLPFQDNEDLLILDYLDTVRDLFLLPFLKRQAFICALMANFTLIEFDACEFSSATILLNINIPLALAAAAGGGISSSSVKGKMKAKSTEEGKEEDEEEEEEEDEEVEEELHSFLLHFAFPYDFPSKSEPEVSFSDLARGRDRVPVSRDRGGWRYSPRWEGKRMAEAVVEFARGVIREEYLMLARVTAAAMRETMMKGGGGEGGMVKV